MTELIVATACFIVLHFIPATPLRALAVELVGRRAYMALFGMLSLAGFVWMVLAFSDAARGDLLWHTGDIWKWINVGLMFGVFVLLVAGVSAPRPFGFAGRSGTATELSLNGILAVTRYPLMWSLVLWGVLHLINRPEPASLLFFGSLSLLSISGAAWQERRLRSDLAGDWTRVEAQTSFVPFAALLSGRSKLVLKDIGLWRLGIAAGLWLGALLLHRTLLGVSPIPV